MPHDYLIECAVQHEPAYALADCLTLTDNLQAIAVRCYEAEDEEQEFSHEELASLLQQRLPARFEADFIWLNEDECKLIDLSISLLAQSAPLPEQAETAGHFSLTMMGYLYLYDWEGQLWPVFPLELQGVWERLRQDEALLARQRRNQELLTYAQALANLYGAYEMEQLAAVWNQHRRDKISLDNAERFLEEVEERQSSFWLDCGLVIHDSILGEDELDELMERVEGLPYYMPTKRVIASYAREHYYEDPRPELTAILDFLRRVVPDDAPRREDLDFEIVMSCEQSWESREVADLLAGYGFPFDDDNVLREFGRLYRALWDNTRQWALRGETPANHAREYGGRTPAFELPALQSEKQVKVGRNEPCPCGSGKKYKKCCGR